MSNDYQRVRCNRCKWDGLRKDLKPIYVRSFTAPDDIDIVPGCPACQSDQWLEYDDSVPKDVHYYILMLEAKVSLRNTLETKLSKLLHRARSML